MNAAINPEVMLKTNPVDLDLPNLEQVFYHPTFVKIINELEAPKSHASDYGGYNYRSAEDINAALKPILLKYKCSVILRKFDIDDGFEIYAYIIFKDQKYMRCELPGVASYDFTRDLQRNSKISKTQQYAAYQSYAKKYALCNLLLIDDSQNDLDALTNKNIQNEHQKENKQNQQKSHFVTQADCDRALQQINNLPMDLPLEQAVNEFNQIIRSYPDKFYQILNDACCKKYAEIEQHLYAMQNAQQTTPASNNTGNNSQPKNVTGTKSPAVQQQNNVQTATANNPNVLITSKQHGELEVFIDERGLDMQEVCKHLAVDSLKQIKVAELSVIKGEIERMAHEVIKQ